MKKAAYVLAGLGLIATGVVLGQWVYPLSPSQPQSEALKTLRSAYNVIQEAYVEPVSGDSLTTASVEAMVETLDPFSTYISATRMKDVEETFRGSFEGIGVTYELIGGARGQDTIGVVEVLPGGPSAKAGLRAGDRIIAVNGTSAVGWSHQEVQNQLKGPEGSTVSVTLRRPERSRSIDTTIARGTVPLQTVEASYMMDVQTGYIRLSRFARTTEREVSEAIASLKEDGMERLVLDLRGNAGGLMAMAERVADEFLVEGQLIVTARSRHDDFGGARYATEDGLLQEAPVIVLVDERSASASEIVAGALQDHDRALIVGRRTFGKGLVQQQFDLRDGSGLRLTVARFYTPSGRLLQRTHGEGRDTSMTLMVPRDSSAVPDSLKHRTDAGRLIIGGGGIQPDRVVPAEDRNPYHRAVEEDGILRDFTRRWVDARTDSLRTQWKGRPEAFVRTFSLPASVYPAFVRYAAERGVRAPLPSSRSATSADGTEGAEGAPRGAFDREDVRAARTSIESAIKEHVAQRVFGTGVRLRVQNQTDPAVAKALQSWSVAQKWADRYPIE